MPKKLTTEEFIAKARAIHGDKYDYSKVVYKNSGGKVIIICPIHGEFEQESNSHLMGRGCKKCSYDKLANERKFTIEKIIAKAKEVHGDLYDYSEWYEVGYKNKDTKMPITCKKCGWRFKQTPGHHIHEKNGCPQCGRKQAGKTLGEKMKGKPGNRRIKQEVFEKRFKEKYGESFDISNFRYKDAHTPGVLVCRKCGNVFTRTSNQAFSRVIRCPACSERGQSDHVYLLVDSEYKATRMKIGITNNITRRLQNLRRGNKHSGLQPTPFKIFKRACYKVGPGKAYEIEQMFHRYYASRNLGYTGFDGATEWFEYDPQAEKLLAEIVANMKISA